MSKPSVNVPEVTVFQNPWKPDAYQFNGIIGIGHPNYGEGTFITSSRIEKIDLDAKTIETRNTLYHYDTITLPDGIPSEMVASALLDAQ